MGFLGGWLAYQFLRRRYPGGQGLAMPDCDPYEAAGVSKLRSLFGPGIFAECAGKTVLDFGCGEGASAVELALAGCNRVIGLDIQEHHLQTARARAEAAGVASRCIFVAEWSDPVDRVLSMDSFEHFSDPAGILRQMRGLLRPDGKVLVEFGYPWLHPYGGHLFSVFPWAHLLFTEAALIRWRTDFKHDGATRFGEVAGGLNQMTVRRFERLVAASPLRMESCELLPIRGANRLHNRLTREFLTSLVRARLTPR